MSDNKHDDGGFAFPWTSVRDGTTNEWCTGMTLIDRFAGQIARSAYQMQQDHGLSPREIAEECYRMAEAMVAEKRRRERGSNDESSMSSAESADREAAAGLLSPRWCSAEDTYLKRISELERRVGQAEILLEMWRNSISAGIRPISSTIKWLNGTQ